MDLAPTKREGRSWTSYSIFTLWANDVHSLGNYAFAIGLFALGLGGWQILLALGIGAALLFGLLTLSGFMGVKTGVPFPVMSRISFGIRGAQIASLLRGAVAVAWFGIQTYLASVVFRVMLVAMFPALARPGQQTPSWGCPPLAGPPSLVLWVVQLVIVSFGMEMIRKYEAFAGPVILATMAAMAIWIFMEAGGSIAWSSNNALEGLDMWRTIFAGGALWVSIYGTFVLNFCDFTRSAVSKNAVVRGNFWGIPINMLLFGAIVVVMAGGQFKINGTIIQSPSDIVQTIPNTLFLVLACLALLILTIAVNLMANFVAPVYALTNLFPKRLNFRKAAVVSAVIGLVILPWNLYNNPLVIVYFLGGLGALLGPLFGVVMADYWLIRRGKVNVPELYTASPDGAYFYQQRRQPAGHHRHGAGRRRGPPASPSFRRWPPRPPSPGSSRPASRQWCTTSSPTGRNGWKTATASPSPSPAPTDQRLPASFNHQRLPPQPRKGTTMRILVANVNTTESMTESIAAQARAVAAPGTEIVGITPRFGADSCEGNFESYLAAIAVMDAVTSYPEPFDAVVQAGYGEHGREGLQELLDVPVVDITEAAASTAMFLGHKYSVVTTLDRAVPLIEDRLKLAGLDARCASVRASGMAVLELEEEPERAVEAIIERGACWPSRQDKAEVIVLGCGGMAGLDEQIRQRAGVPVVDGVASAVTIAESLVRMRLSTSKVRTYAAPRPKTVIGWPLNSAGTAAQLQNTRP